MECIECSQLGKGSHLVTFYVPYWIYDITGLHLIPSWDGKSIVGGLKSDGEHYSDRKLEEVDLIILGFPDRNKEGVYVRNPNCDFSEPFADNTVGNYTRVEKLQCRKDSRDQRNYEFEVGVEIALVTGIFRGLIKRITLAPRHIIHNCFGDAIEIRQICFIQVNSSEINSNKPIRLVPNGYIHFHWNAPVKRKALQFRIVPHSEAEGMTTPTTIEQQQWSSFVNIGEVGNNVIRIRRETAPTLDLLSIQTTNAFASLYISLTKADQEFPPLHIINQTLTTEIRFCQKRSNQWEVVQPLHDVPFAWYDLEQTKKILVEIKGTKLKQYKFDMRENEPSYPKIEFAESNM
ncbi:hypothetical protein RFI_38866, partial [Reticulomyxa filosa]